MAPESIVVAKQNISRRETVRFTEDSLLKALFCRHVAGLLPVAFEVNDPDDRGVRATVDGSLSICDHYTFEIRDLPDPRLTVVASVVVDAIEGS